MFVLLAQRASDPAWHAGHAPFWASWPAPGTVFTKETFTAADLAELQDEDMVSQMRGWEGREVGWVGWGGGGRRRVGGVTGERRKWRGGVADPRLLETRPAPARPAPLPAPPARRRYKALEITPPFTSPPPPSPPKQAKIATQEQAWIRRVYRGEQGGLGVAALADLQAVAVGANVTYEEFQHLASVVSVCAGSGGMRAGNERRWPGAAFIFFFYARAHADPPPPYFRVATLC